MASDLDTRSSHEEADLDAGAAVDVESAKRNLQALVAAGIQAQDLLGQDDSSDDEEDEDNDGDNDEDNAEYEAEDA
ncbi:hypothetical protein GGF43_004410, partial [Coemansia sp. RSA 2618]